MFKKLIYIFCIFLVVIKNSDGRVIKIASLEWPPFTCALCPESGITIPIIKSILEENGDTLETQFVPWSRAIKMVNEGKSDLLWPAWASDVFGESLELTVPIFQSPLIVAVRKESKMEVEKIEDLLRYRVGVVQDYGYFPELLKLIKSNPKKFETVTKDVMNVEKLKKKRIDAIIIDQYNLFYLDPKHQLKILPDSLKILPLMLAGKKENVAYFNKLLIRYKEKKSIQEMIELKLKELGHFYIANQRDYFLSQYYNMPSYL